MIKIEATIVNDSGLHTRPGTRFAKQAQTYESRITLRKGEKEADAKSLLKLLKAGISKGDAVVLEIEGPDEERAAKELGELLARLEG